MSGYGQNYPAPAPAPTGGAGTIGGVPRQLFLAGIAGSALAFLGTFLNWVTAEVEGVSGSGSASGLDGDGMFTLITSLIAVGLFAFGMVKNQILAAAGAAVPALITLVFAVLNLLDIERIGRAAVEADVPEGTPSSEVDMYLEMMDLSPGIGLYLVLLGALVGVGVGGFLFTKARSR